MRRSVIFVLFLILGFFSKGFAQPLETFIESGIKNSPFLADFNNQKLASKLDSLILIASYKPQINQVTQAVHYPSGNGWGYDDAITNGGNYAALVSLAQPLFVKKRIQEQLQTIELLNQTVKQNAKITLIDLKKSITAQYLTSYNDFAQYQFNKSIFDLLNKEQNTVKALVEKGVYQVTDYMNLQIVIRAQSIAINQAFIQYKNDLSILSLVSGFKDQSNVVLTKPNLVPVSKQNLENSPVFAQFHIDSLKNKNSKLLLNQTYRPKVNFIADAGFTGITPQNLPHNAGTSLGINLSVPIYDGKQRKLQLKKIDLAENTRIYYKNFYSTQYKLQSDQLIKQLELTNNLSAEIEQQLLDQEKIIEVYRKELESGLVRFLDFITVLNNYTTTKATSVITENNKMQIINQLNYLK